MTKLETPRPPLPPFTRVTALAKVRAAEDAWNSRDPERVALAYTIDSEWRNRDQFVTGRPAIVAFLAGKWAREEDYRLVSWATASRSASSTSAGSPGNGIAATATNCGSSRTAD